MFWKHLSQNCVTATVICDTHYGIAWDSISRLYFQKHVWWTTMGAVLQMPSTLGFSDMVCHHCVIFQVGQNLISHSPRLRLYLALKKKKKQKQRHTVSGDLIQVLPLYQVIYPYLSTCSS